MADKENLRAVIDRIMRQHQLSSQDVKKERGRIDVHSTGGFDCACGHSWYSGFSWVKMDLIEKEIAYRFKMKCILCRSECIPTFTLEQMEVIIARAVCIYKGIPYESQKDGGAYFYRRFTAPHKPPLCEKCGWGVTKCWMNLRQS